MFNKIKLPLAKEFKRHIFSTCLLKQNASRITNYMQFYKGSEPKAV